MKCSYVVRKNVRIGLDAKVGDFCVIGEVPAGLAEGELETIVGDDCLIRALIVIYAGNRIGRGFRTGNHVNIRELNQIGDDVSIGTLSVVEHRVAIEDGLRIHSQVFVPEFSTLKRGCWIGPKATLTNARYPRSHRSKEHLLGVVIGEDAVVGASAIVLPGAGVGRKALVGAGAVVTRDVEEGAVVVGNPAKPARSVRHLKYSGTDEAACP